MENLPATMNRLTEAFGILKRSGALDAPGGNEVGDAILQGLEACAMEAAVTGVTASGAPRGSTGGQIGRMAAGQRAATSPERRGGPGASVGSGASPVVITAAAGSPSVAPGQALESSEELAELTTETLESIGRDRAWGQRRYVARGRWQYPEDRQLGDSLDENTRKLNNVVGINSPRYDRRTGALVASGGVCLPVDIDYSVPTWVSSDRPLRDALPSFQATRGGVTFTTPPDIGTVDLQGGTASGSGTATRIWTEATDASPGGATKPVWVVACGTPQTVYVNAIPTRVQFGNMQSRFAPEQVAANTEQAVAAAAREAELELLALMYSATNQVLASQYLGATRDLLASVDLIAAGYRYSHRYPKGIGLTAVFPEWAADVIRADMTRELAHDNTNGRDSMAITDAMIEEWFSARNIDVVWTIDALQAGTYGTGGHAIPAQYFPRMTAGAKPQWPGQSSDGAFVLSWLLFVTGTFQFLDGGRLDLGVVRDSVLDATNDYETFVETFEGLAFRGNEAYQVQSTILPAGGSAGTIAPSGYHE